MRSDSSLKSIYYHFTEFVFEKIMKTQITMNNTLILTFFLALLFSLTAGCKSSVLSKLREPKAKCAAGLPASSSSKEYSERGMNAITEGSYGCALDNCRKALDLDSKNADARVCRAYAYLKLGEYDLAESDFDEAVNLQPDNPLTLYQRSHLYRETKQFTKALTDINKSIELMPAHYQYAYRAQIYADMQDFENAARDYTEAIRQEPGTQHYYLERADIYRRLGRTESAESDHRKYEEMRAAEEKSNISEPEKNSDTVMNDLALDLPEPVYPPSARAVKANGEVRVRIDVDQKGNVLSAKAINGHPLLRASAEQAARQAKFKPRAMTGIIIFNFTAK
jgi:TonB family protein